MKRKAEEAKRKRRKENLRGGENRVQDAHDGVAGGEKGEEEWMSGSGGGGGSVH